MQVLLTGSSGFIGQRLQTALLAHPPWGEQLTQLRTLSRNPLPLPNPEARLDPRQGDLTRLGDSDGLQLAESLCQGVETLFHLAAYTHDTDGNHPDLAARYQQLNVTATARLGDAAVAAGVKRFIFVSSVKAGGSAPDGICLDEKSQRPPDGLYGKTKREAEEYLLHLASRSNMEVVIIRPALVYGTGMKGNLRLLFTAIQRGLMPPLPETGNRRSMIALDDLVNLLLLGASHPAAANQIYNATDGIAYSSRTIYLSMCHAAGRSPYPGLPVTLFAVAAGCGELLKKWLPVPFDHHRYHKLLGNDCFSSEKAERQLGFKA
ncbi:MAG: NAD-dependent epimerase/dehydratase family protein, partial [Gammaproteobacteria bacterium]|nr:NAD-dependent epimerase/dehydratase family protein [Gammaproteobacteria bacterium]